MFRIWTEYSIRVMFASQNVSLNDYILSLAEMFAFFVCKFRVCKRELFCQENYVIIQTNFLLAKITT